MEQTITITPKAIIRIVGTSHIAAASAREIRRVASDFSPDIVAVELDRGRLEALKDRAAGKKEERLPLSMVRRIGLTGYIFVLVGRALQKRLGDIVRVEPGVDMLAAVEYAARNDRMLALVDQDILITMRRLSREFRLREKMRIFWDILTAPFSKRYAFDLHKVPEKELLEKLIHLLRERYPSLYKVLIVERNIVMARNLDAIVRRNPGKKILLVIGAGHGDDLRQRLQHLERLATVE
jgi:pheromone shutdown protein TraB